MTLSVLLLVRVGDLIADDNDIVLWEVVADRTTTSSSVETFEPGNVPAGHRETVPLDTPEEGQEVVVYLDIRHGGQGSFRFDWGSLSPGTLLTDDGPKSRSEWLSYAIEGCGGT